MSDPQSSERRNIASGVIFFFKFSKFTIVSLRRSWRSSLLLIIFVVIASAFYEYTAYQIGLIASEFYGALTRKSYDRFIWTVKLSVIYVLSISVTVAVRSMVIGHLNLIMRDSITTRLHRYYFNLKRYYTIANLTELDNPDQRLTQDIGSVCDTTTEILPTLIINPILVIFYTYKCVEKAGWLGPIAAYILFIVFAILTRLLTTWTSAAIYEQDRQEGNFRFLHVQLRTSNESAAFLNVGWSQHHLTNIAFNRLLHSFRISVNRKASLLCVTTMSAYTGGILNYLALGIVLFGGLFGTLTTSEITVLISETSFFVLYLINQLTNLIDLANQITHLVGVGHRVLNLEHFLTECKSYDTPASYSASRCPASQILLPRNFPPLEWNATERENIFVHLEHVSLGLPLNPGHLLLHDITLTLRLGQPLVITGPSGTGKTALLRMLADLWPALPSNSCVPEQSMFYRSCVLNQIFVPQKPFIPATNFCPPALFESLDLSVGSSFAAEPSARVLHLAYLLLSVSESPNSLLASESSLVFNFSSVSRSERVSQGLPESLADEPFTSPTQVSNLLDLDQCLCGYPLRSFMIAFALLVEFRLVHSKAVDELLTRLAKLQHTFSVPRNGYSWFATVFWRLCQTIRYTCQLGCKLGLHGSKPERNEWPTCYSPGEMQRLVLASVCYQKPCAVFLDEATSQLNDADTLQAYSSLQRRKITTISVAHNQLVRRFHTTEFRLTPRSVYDGSDDNEAQGNRDLPFDQGLSRWELINPI